MFSIAAHFHFTKSYQFVELLTFPKLRHTQNTQHFLKFHQNIFWLTNICIQELCNLLTKLYALQSCNKSIQKYFAQLCIWDNGIVPRPSPSLVLTMILDYCSGLSLIHHIIVPDFHTQTNK